MAVMRSARKSPVPRSLSADEPGGSSGSARHRADGAEARSRLLHAALHLFAEKGFSKTSTRDIAQAAGVNLAAIKYYFGDKAGLYRAVYTEPISGLCQPQAPTMRADLPLREALAIFLGDFVAPLKQNELLQLCIRLHYREMLEPTGLWQEEIDREIKPSHAALVGVLAHHMGLKKPDDDIHRLAFSIVGLVLQMFIARDVVDAIRPSLIGSHAAIDLWIERLIDYAEAMVQADARRRKDAARKKA